MRKKPAGNREEGGWGWGLAGLPPVTEAVEGTAHPEGWLNHPLGSEPGQEETEEGFQTWDLGLCGVARRGSPEVRGRSTAPRGPPCSPRLGSPGAAAWHTERKVGC